jgi:prefoldin subunit 5
MIENRIQESELAVEGSRNIPAHKKAELLSLLSKLKSAITKVSPTHHEDAQSIAKCIEAAASQATQTKKKPEALKNALRKLKESVERFETSHPELVARVNEFATILAEMGL